MWRKNMLCAPEGDVHPGTTVPASSGTAPAAATTPAPEPPAGSDPAPQVTTRGGKVLPLTQSSIDKIKRDQLERGKRAAANELEQRAKSLGYASADDMWREIERNKRRQAGAAQPNKKRDDKGKGGGNQPAPQRQARVEEPANGRGQRDDRRQREMDERLARERRERIRAQKRAEDAQREAWAAEAAGELKVVALGVGIKDPDYAATLLTRECEQQRARFGGDEVAYSKWLDQLDERKFFEELRKTRPALFEDEIRPATTGTVPSNGAPPPGAGQVTQSAANATQKSVRGMSREQWHEELRRRGLRVPTT